MINYNPSDFTLDAYKKLLIIAKKHYVFHDYGTNTETKNTIYWRHDVDFSLEYALKLAEIENQHQVKASYFLLMHSAYYNLFDQDALALVKKIMALGHTIGLHFDKSYYESHALSEFISNLSFEKKILENLFNCAINVFSFHNPNQATQLLQDNKYAGMINTYSKHFKEQVRYCSDSNGYWRYQSLTPVLLDNNTKPLQVLTHPIWWTDKPLWPRDKIVSHLEQKQQKSLARYDQVLQTHGRVNASQLYDI
jgi:hypothetical protein